MKTVAIIPAYNEEKSIGNVLDMVVNHPLIDEVIVVDDGSVDSTSLVAKNHNASRVITLKENVGKGKALDIGVKNTEADIMLFLDADLINFKSVHVTNLIKPVMDNECEMTVGAIVREGIRKVVGDTSLEKRMKAFRELCNMRIKLPPDFAKSPRQEAEDD